MTRSGTGVANEHRLRGMASNPGGDFCRREGTEFRLQQLDLVAGINQRPADRQQSQLSSESV
jgi:hypothetical protein